MVDPNRLWRGALNEIAPGVWYLPVIMSNAYFLGHRNGRWVLVDTGVRGGGWRIKHAAMETFGRPPECIVLTHGHFDHVGGLPQLAEEWKVPVYAHPLELPFLNGSSDYPPPDPTVGGFMANLARAFPHRGIDLHEYLRVLDSNSVPGALDWRWIHTPGHTSGHISLFRESDRALITGDALITVNQENPIKLMSQVREFRSPPTYLTQDWPAAHRSISALAQLHPHLVATGHGLPVVGNGVGHELERFAKHFKPPSHGRYVQTPVRTDEYGVLYVPPPAIDPLPTYAAGIGLATAAGIMLYQATRKRRPEKHEQAALSYDEYRRNGYRE